MPLTTIWLVSLSSATRIRWLCTGRAGRAAIGAGDAAAGARLTAGANGSWQRNEAPRPGSLWTLTWPPICSHSCLTMARPRPVPPYSRVVELSA